MHKHHHHVGYVSTGGKRVSAGGTNRVILPPHEEPASPLALQQEADRIEREARASVKPEKPLLKLTPVDFSQAGNELRPHTFDQMVGQERLKPFLRRLVTCARAEGRPLDHMLLVGSAGTGKTTTAMVMAQELGRRCYLIKAPVALDVFEALARQCKDTDIIVVDEIHLQVQGDRRGVTQAADPEIYYGPMEDHRLETHNGPIPWPRVTFLATTTDEGLLPEPMLMRFSLRPPLDPYTVEEMAALAHANASALHLELTGVGASVFAEASRMVPRVVNGYMRNARALFGERATINQRQAEEVITRLNGVTLDGLTRDMQNMLRFLLRSPREVKGEIRYQASVNTIATALGKSRDSKAVALYVESHLIERGFVGVGHGGRHLTNAGIQRAQELAAR